MELAPDSKATLDRFLADVERRAFRMARFASGNTYEALDLVQEAMFQFVRRYANRPPKEWNPLFYDIIQRFGSVTGVPILLNTSFNLRAEPIVASPANAFETFSKSDLDILVMDHYLLTK